MENVIIINVSFWKERSGGDCHAAIGEMSTLWRRNMSLKDNATK